MKEIPMKLNTQRTLVPLVETSVLEQAMNELSFQLLSFEGLSLDRQGVENRIQQTIGVLNLLELLKQKKIPRNTEKIETLKRKLTKVLKQLFSQKRELLYGYNEDYRLSSPKVSLQKNRNVKSNERQKLSSIV